MLAYFAYLLLVVYTPNSDLTPPANTPLQTLQPGQSHTYTLHLDKAQAVWIVAQQRGVDIVLSVASGQGDTLASVDAPFDEWGPEALLFVTPSAGSFSLRVDTRTQSGPSGQYRLELQHTEMPNAARAAWTTASQAYQTQQSSNYASAIANFSLAAAQFAALDNLQWQIYAHYCKAVLHRLNQENSQALAGINDLLPLYQKHPDPLLQAFTYNEQGLLLQLDSRYHDADTSFQKAEQLFAQQDHPQGQAMARNNQGLNFFRQGDLSQAIQLFEASLHIKEKAGIKRGMGETLINIGFLHRRLGHTQPMLESYQRALELFQAEGNELGIAQVQNHFGLYHSSMGAYRKALQAYRGALESFQKLGMKREQARATNNIGKLYNDLGDSERAILFLQKALTMRREAGDQTHEITTLMHLGNAYAQEDQIDKAQSLYSEALQKAQILELEKQQSAALIMLSLLALKANSIKQALAFAQQALALHSTHKDLLSRARAHAALGKAQIANGDFSLAQDSLQAALNDYKTGYYLRGQAETLYALAQCAKGVNDLNTATTYLHQAIELFEKQREKVEAPDLRAKLMASKYQIYEAMIAVYMARHQQDPTQRFDLIALDYSERGRARVLLEQLHETQGTLDSRLSPIQNQQLEQANQQLISKLKAYRKLKLNQQTDADAAAAELETAWVQLTELERQVAAEAPTYGALFQPQPLTWQTIQQAIPQDTLLRIYALASEASYLWEVTHTQIVAHVLPDRATIANQVQDYTHALSLRDHSPANRQRTETLKVALSKALMPKNTLANEHPKLVIVADGVLHSLPFATLRTSSEDQKLVQHHTAIAMLPSASVLTSLRQRKRQPAPNHLLAILADPIFEPNDPRLQVQIDDKRDTLPASTRSVEAETGLLRLPGTAQEAQNLAKIPDNSSAIVTRIGTAASRDWVMSGALKNYRYIHFATHGLIDDRRPELSTLALSFFDEHGKQQTGFLSLNDIYNLQLNADLVVLSACETALGQQVRGEGLISLSRAFIYAGSKAVIASLWRVPERATTELMTHLYRGMLQEGLSPAQALRQAQLQLQKNRRWRDPYYWAGFVYQGDWQRE